MDQEERLPEDGGALEREELLRRSRSDLVTLLISLAFLAWYLVQFFTEG